MIDRIAFIDIGELGWSLYLSAHIRWLKKNTDTKVIVVTYPDRKCLYADMVNKIMDVPELFGKKYNIKWQDSFKLRYVGWDELRLFFLPRIPSGYRIPDYNKYPNRFMSDNRIFAAYKYSKNHKSGKEILVFPRFRPGLSRNLPLDFYLQLIKTLCDKFPELKVRAIGTANGAYNIKARKPNYVNWVGRGNDLQDMIDRCQSAVAAIGSQTGPTKISLLQGVPTFMVGHQKSRHTEEENWMKTKSAFYEIEKKEYQTFNIDDCIHKTVDFVKECQ